MDSLVGKLLVASPSLVDPNFAQSVTLVVQHDSSGALGLVLTQPTDLTVRGAWEKISDSPCTIEGVLHRGGPCEGVLMVLHDNPDQAQAEVLPGVYFSTDRDQVQWLIAHHTGPARCFVGYAGWTGGQLESELELGSWIVTDASAQVAFDAPPTLWRTMMEQLDPIAGIIKRNAKIVPEDPRNN